MWIRVALGVVVFLVFVLILAMWQAQNRWQRATIEMQRRLNAAAVVQSVTHYSEAELVGLPTPVARYFRTVLKDGQPIIKRAHITWKGEFNMGKPGADKWAPFTAEQDFVPSAPGFIWDARVAMAPGMNTLVRDGFVAGAGSMFAKVLGLITVANSHDTPAIATGALQRYLGEAAWLPTALLPSQGVVWEPIDENRARATITANAVTTSLEFRFGADGLIVSAYTLERVFDDGKSPPTPHPWQARNLRYGKINGTKVPVDSTVEWLFPAGAYAYWRGQPVKIEYDYGIVPAAVR
jgi:hypothetical protein